MTGDEPPYLAVGTEVSAKYRGAFCEAKVKKLIRTVKCKVILKESQIPMMVTDDKIKGVLKVGEVVELQDPDSGQNVEGTISKLTDSSMYTVVFDDGDERTLRRSQLCLKGEKHFIESETLDNLPLSHPEHFGTPVMHGKKMKRGRYSGGAEYETDDTSSEEGIPKRAFYKGRLQELVGKVMILELGDKRKQQVPVLVVLPDAQTPDPKKKDHILVRSFKDGKFVYTQRKELKDFTRDIAIKNEDKALKPALEKALLYYDNQDLPLNWDHDELLGTDDEGDFNEEESSDDEPSEDKDCFVAQLYKFMDDRGTPINKAPALVNKDLNLYRLFKVVQNIGGYNKVTNQMKWRMVYSKMNLPPVNTASHQIKNAYKKYLHAFEDFYRKLGSSMGTISRPGRSRNNSGRGMPHFRGKDKEEKDVSTSSEDVKDDKDKEEADVSPSKDRPTPKRVTRQDVSEEAAKKETEVKKPIKKEEAEDTKKKVVKKEEGDKKDNESKKISKKEEAEAKKMKEEEAKKIKEENEKKEESKKKDEDKKSTKKEEGKKLVKGDDIKKKEDIIMKKAKVVVKKEDQKIKKENETENTDKKTVAANSEKKVTAQNSEKKSNTTEKKQTVSASDKKQQPVDKKATVSGDKSKPSQQNNDKKTNSGVDKGKTEVPKTEGEDKAKPSPKKLVRRRSMRKDEDAPSPSPKVVIQKEVKVNLGKKDVKQEIAKKIKKIKPEGQSEEKEKKSVSAKESKNCPLGTRLKVKYGGGKTEKIYDAKVVECQDDGSGVRYLVHYAGWNTRYDEWIHPDRIVSIVQKPSEDSVAKKTEKKLKDGASPKAGKPSPVQSALTPQVLKKRARSGPGESPSSSPARSEKARSPAASITSEKKKSRPTRSNSVEFRTLDSLPVKAKRTRRNSGLTESSDIISHASFTDDTDNSDEETDKAEDMSEDSQSVPEPSKPCESDMDSKSPELSKSTDEMSHIDLVEVKVLYETTSAMELIDEEKPAETQPETVVPKIETQEEKGSIEEEKDLTNIANDNIESSKVMENIDSSEPEEKVEENVSISEQTKVEETESDVKLEEVKKEDNEENIDIKCNEESNSLDKFDFKEEEEETSLPEWTADKQDGEMKPGRGRPRKTLTKVDNKKEMKKTKMTMAERKYMGQTPFSEMEPPAKKMKEEEIAEVKDNNDEDTEEDNEMDRKKVKKKTKKKETLDSDSSDVDHKRAVKKDTKTPGKQVTKSKKRLKEGDDLDRRSLMSDDDSSISSEKCETDNPQPVNNQTVIEPKSSAETIEISTTCVNTPPTSPEQDTPQHSNAQTEQNIVESQGNTSPSSNDGSTGSGNVAGSDSSDVIQLGKRKKEPEDVTPAKKKRRGKSKSNSEKKSKPIGSDSDESCNQTSGSSSPNKSRPRSPRTPKYNLNLEEGKYLEGEARISFLMDKAQEIRRIYMDLKAEVALIDRRRKRAKRKERESLKSAENDNV